MKGNINLISYDCYQQATEKQLAGLKWKENRVYYISEIHNEKMQDEIYGYIDDRCRRLSLSTVVNDIYRFDLLKEFLNEKCTSCSSITDKKWEELERSYKAFLYAKQKKYAFERVLLMEQQMNNGMSQKEACQNWGMQFHSEAYQKLALILVQSFTKGSKEAATMMEAEEREAFQRRVERAKQEGEEAATRLLFPMIVLLCQVMLLVMYPALIRFQGF